MFPLLTYCLLENHITCR